MPASEIQQFVVLPPRGLQAASASVRSFLLGLEGVRSFAAARDFIASTAMKVKARFRVLDSIHENGAKLVEMSTDTAKDLLADQPGLRIVPVVYYKPAISRPTIEAKVKAAATALRTVVSVQSRTTNKPVKSVLVVAFTDYENRIGAQGTTNAQGKVALNLGGAAKIERVYAFGPTGFWGALRKNVSAKSEVKLKIAPVDLGFTDCVRHFYGNAPEAAGEGVKVAVVDTGVGPHQDLVVAGGENTVVGEDPNDFADNGDRHGTHVAGIVAARGTPPNGLRGLAPAATLFSYRVFGKGAEGASNFSIAKAIDRAVAAGCDIINLSLGGEDQDPATASAIHDARQAGTLVVAAAGNDGREKVSFPAADPLCLAVAAMGVKKTFPAGSSEEGDVMGPFGTNKKEFIAAFSNIGPEVDLTGPGVGVLSTVPDGYAPMSGTSMASPAVAGVAAALLARLPAVLGMPRDQDRSAAIAKAVLSAAASRGFPAELEGKGLPLL